MLIAADDFRIKAENFDPTNGWNVLRVMCGAFMFPHVAGKFAAGGLSAATVGFFAKAGFQPPELWVYLAAVSETLCGVCLVLGICTRYAALGAAAVLGVAVYALQVVKGFGWTWNTGGYEYPVFWGLVSSWWLWRLGNQRWLGGEMHRNLVWSLARDALRGRQFRWELIVGLRRA